MFIQAQDGLPLVPPPAGHSGQTAGLPVRSPVSSVEGVDRADDVAVDGAGIAPPAVDMPVFLFLRGTFLHFLLFVTRSKTRPV